MGLSIVGPMCVMTVAQHRRIAKQVKENCRRDLHLQGRATQICIGDETHSISIDKTVIYQSMSDGMSGEPVKLWYAADVVIFDLNVRQDYKLTKSLEGRKNLK